MPAEVNVEDPLNTVPSSHLNPLSPTYFRRYHTEDYLCQKVLIFTSFLMQIIPLLVLFMHPSCGHDLAFTWCKLFPPYQCGGFCLILAQHLQQTPPFMTNTMMR